MITLPDPDFTEEEIQAILQKLAVAVKLLESVCAIKDAVEMRCRQIEFEEILLQHVAAAVGARHRGQPLRALKTGGVVAEFLESFEVTTWTAPEVEQLKRRGCLNVVQQRGDVLTHVMIARALPELVCVMLIMRQRPCGDVFDGVGAHSHSMSCYSICRRVVNGHNPHGLIRLNASSPL